jgi:hypothetical protein
MPGTLVSRRLSAPTALPVRMTPSAARSTVSSSHSVFGCALRKQRGTRRGSCFPLFTDCFELTSRTMECADLGPVANGDAVTV